MENIAQIMFAPCTGFGEVGRSATLMDCSGEVIGTGYGETNEEAVLEALMDTGMSFDDAFDTHYAVLTRCVKGN